MGLGIWEMNKFDVRPPGGSCEPSSTVPVTGNSPASVEFPAAVAAGDWVSGDAEWLAALKVS